MLPGGENHPEAARHADRRGAPHRQAPDGVDEIQNLVDLQNLVGIGQPGLIHDPQTVIRPLQGPLTQILHANLAASTVLRVPR